MDRSHIFDFDNWYTIFKKHSIKSISIELSEDFISYLTDEDSIFLPKGAISSATIDQLSDDESCIEIESESDLDSERFRILNSQIKRSLNDLGGKVFIKLNSTSPKDAVWINGGNLMCVNLEQIYLLLKSSSRISSEIDTLKCNSSSENVKFSLIIRKWSNLHPAMEFRCFVVNGIPIGASQRDCSCYYDFLVNDKNTLESTLFDFVSETVLPNIMNESLIIDIYVDKNHKCWIIDLGELIESNNTFLFDFKELSDLQNLPKNNLEENRKVFELRVVETNDDICKYDSKTNNGPIEAVDIASGKVPYFGDWRTAFKFDRNESYE